MSRPALTVIGLDAATLDVIDPLLEQGQLPHLERLFARGSRGTLRSTTHPLTTQAWSTMVTGVNAGRHGMWDFSERDESGYHLGLVNGSYRRAPAIWDRLSAAGRRVGVVNVPFSWPAPAVDGFAIAGLDAAAREQGMTHPPGLLAELRERFGPLELDHRFPVDDAGALQLDQVRRAVEQKTDATLWLLERFEPELLWVVFMSADHIHHVAWPDWEARGAESAVAEVYRELDRAVGRIVEAVGEDADVMVVSDHGGGSLDGVVNLNAWLAQEGFLGYAEQAASKGSAELLRRAVFAAHRVRRRLPKRLRYALKQRAPKLRDKAYELRSYNVIDWSRTRAFSYGTFGNIVVNVRGRESQGIVEPGEEYERVRDEIARRALELRSPDGKRIVAAVHRREDLFEGPHIDKVPDLIVEFADYAWLGKGNMTKRTDTIYDTITIRPDSPAAYNGSHRMEGIVAFAGPSAGTEQMLAGSIEDVAPTAFYLLGEPIPDDLEGRVLFEGLRPELPDERPPEYGEAAPVEVGAATSYAADDDAEVKERLRGLGYIE